MLKGIDTKIELAGDLTKFEEFIEELWNKNL